MKKVASNTSPISCLISLGRLDLLKSMFAEVLIPRRMGLDCKGTIWLLSHAKNKGLISSLKDALNTLVDEFAFALDPKLIEESCKRVGEV